MQEVVGRWGRLEEAASAAAWGGEGDGLESPSGLADRENKLRGRCRREQEAAGGSGKLQELIWAFWGAAFLSTASFCAALASALACLAMCPHGTKKAFTGAAIQTLQFINQKPKSLKHVRSLYVFVDTRLAHFDGLVTII